MHTPLRHAWQVLVERTTHQMHLTLHRLLQRVQKQLRCAVPWCSLCFWVCTCVHARVRLNVYALRCDGSNSSKFSARADSIFTRLAVLEQAGVRLSQSPQANFASSAPPDSRKMGRRAWIDPSPSHSQPIIHLDFECKPPACPVLGRRLFQIAAPAHPLKWPHSRANARVRGGSRRDKPRGAGPRHYCRRADDVERAAEPHCQTRANNERSAR